MREYVADHVVLGGKPPAVFRGLRPLTATATELQFRLEQEAKQDLLLGLADLLQKPLDTRRSTRLTLELEPIAQIVNLAQGNQGKLVWLTRSAGNHGRLPPAQRDRAAAGRIVRSFLPCGTPPRPERSDGTIRREQLWPRNPK
jgi:hypothetical protein